MGRVRADADCAARERPLEPIVHDATRPDLAVNFLNGQFVWLEGWARYLSVADACAEGVGSRSRNAPSADPHFGACVTGTVILQYPTRPSGSPTRIVQTQCRRIGGRGQGSMWVELRWSCRQWPMGGVGARGATKFGDALEHACLSAGRVQSCRAGDERKVKAAWDTNRASSSSSSSWAEEQAGRGTRGSWTCVRIIILDQSTRRPAVSCLHGERGGRGVGGSTWDTLGGNRRASPHTSGVRSRTDASTGISRWVAALGGARDRQCSPRIIPSAHSPAHCPPGWGQTYCSGDGCSQGLSQHRLSRPAALPASAVGLRPRLAAHWTTARPRRAMMPVGEGRRHHSTRELGACGGRERWAQEPSAGARPMDDWRRRHLPAPPAPAAESSYCTVLHCTDEGTTSRLTYCSNRLTTTFPALPLLCSSPRSPAPVCLVSNPHSNLPTVAPGPGWACHLPVHAVHHKVPYGLRRGTRQPEPAGGSGTGPPRAAAKHRRRPAPFCCTTACCLAGPSAPNDDPYPPRPRRAADELLYCIGQATYSTVQPSPERSQSNALLGSVARPLDGARLRGEIPPIPSQPARHPSVQDRAIPPRREARSAQPTTLRQQPEALVPRSPSPVHQAVVEQSSVLQHPIWVEALLLPTTHRRRPRRRCCHIAAILALSRPHPILLAPHAIRTRQESHRSCPPRPTMALQPLSIGDILMLSQTAWKIGRAFTHGKKSAPAEFAEVEREANGLSDALKMVADTLHEDGGLLSRAEDETKAAVNGILESARRTLNDLDSFVDRYRVLSRKETSGGFVVERSWADAVLANYRTFRWTTEGGNITDLRNMLEMHSTSINLTMQALQSKSLSRLERTVMPMAENVASIHDRVNGDLGDKIDDLHRIIMAIASGTPSLVAADHALEARSRSSASTISTIDPAPSPAGDRLLEAPPPRTSSYHLPVRQHDRRQSGPESKLASPSRSIREDSGVYSGPLSLSGDGHRMDWGFETGSPPDPRASIGAAMGPHAAGSDTASISSRSVARHRSSIASESAAQHRASVPRRESTTLPHVFVPDDEDDDVQAGRSPRAQRPDVSPIVPRPGSLLSQDGRPFLPPPALPPDDTSGASRPAATPLSFFGSPPRLHSDTTMNRRSQASVRPSTSKSVQQKSDAARYPSNGLDSSSFEKALFRNSAILCDVRAVLLEFAQLNPDEPDPRFNVDMVPACREARICVVRKREHRELGGTKVVTSIWTLADEGTVRIQQKLSEVHETVPYCSCLQPEKVSIPPTEGDIDLRFHGEQWNDPLVDQKKTSWVNYIFATTNDAVAFQSSIYGRTLLGSYRTNKSTVIHDGLRGTFALEEQFANIEMLRLWEDDGISTPGAAGGVLALLHVSSNFGEGWARWWINNSKQQVRVKDDGPRHAKVKGIDLTIVRPGTSGPAADRIRSSSVSAEALQRAETDLAGHARNPGRRIAAAKKVTGVRIEFKSEEEREQFVTLTRRLQERQIPLPDL
nr:hypothetical protein CFP56_33689 [Quercus suber]